MKETIKFLAKELKNKKLLVFIGAGVSANSGLPNWNELITDFAVKLEIIKKEEIDKVKFSNDEYLRIPEIFYKKYGKVEYYNVLKEIFFSKKYQTNSIHKALENMDLDYIITTNYDELLDDLNPKDTFSVVRKDNDLPYASRKMVIKMHGDLRYKNIVLKKTDYDEYEKNFPLISTFIKGLFTTHTVLFIGYSLNDVNVQEILRWLEDILKDDIRKVYLTDFEKSNILLEEKYKDNKIINRISFEKNLKNEEKEKEISKFLEKIYKESKKISKETSQKESFRNYQNFNYLTEENFKEIIPNSKICLNNFGEIEYLEIKEKEIGNFSKYDFILKKSNIDKVIYDIEYNEEEKKYEFKEYKPFQNRINEEKSEKLEKYLENEKKLLEIISNYDLIEFEKFYSEIDLNEMNIQFLVYSHIFFNKIDEAEKLVLNMIEKYKENLDNFHIIWYYYLLYQIENISHDDLLRNKKNLEERYSKIYNKKNQIYDEIFQNKTLLNEEKKIKKLNEKIKKEIGTTYFGKLPPSQEAVFSIKELYRFQLLNGFFWKENSNYRNSLQLYIEILFISFKNNENIEGILFSNRINKIEKFEYFDFQIMLEIDSDELRKLFKNYKMKVLICDFEVKEKLVQLFKNVINLLNQEKKGRLEFDVQLLEKILMIISKIKLKNEQFLEIFEKLIDFKYIVNLLKGYERRDYRNIEYRDLRFDFLNFIINNLEFMGQENFNKLFHIIFKIKADTTIFEILSYHYTDKKYKKFSKSDKIIKFIKNNDELIKCHLLKILAEDYSIILKKEILSALEIKFDLKVFYFLIVEKHIEKLDEKYTNTILEYLNKRINENYSYSGKYEEIINYLIGIFINIEIENDISNKFKNYDNEFFKKYLKKRNYENLWEYSLNKKNYDFSKFTESDLDFFTKIGIKKLLERKNESFEKLIENYVHKNIENDKILSAYFEFKNK